MSAHVGAVAAYLAGHPQAPPTRTPDARAAWLAGVDLADYRARCGALAAHVTTAAIVAAQRGSDALAAMARDLPRPNAAADVDALAIHVGPLVAPDRAALDPDALASVHAFWLWARRTAPTLRHPLAPIVRGWIEANRPEEEHP